MSAVLAEFGFDVAPTFKVTQLDLGLNALAVEPQDVVLGKTEFPVCLRTLSHALLLTQLNGFHLTFEKCAGRWHPRCH
jgi:hypothetical protein